MKMFINIFMFVGVFLCCPSTLFSRIQAENEDEPPKTIRIFLKTGETVDFNAAKVDSITTSVDAQSIWHAGTCQSFDLESIDSVWYMAPSLKITSKDVNFGKVAVGNIKTMSVTLTNTGDYPETYSAYAAGVFNAGHMGDSYIIYGGQSINIDINFIPTDSIDYKGSLLVSSSAADDGMVRLPLMGTGVATDSLEEEVVLPPVYQEFEIMIPEDESLEDFADFKIVNFNGEFPVQNISNVKSIRKIRRTGTTYNVLSSTASISSNGLQAHSFVDAQGNPYFFSISLPDEKPEMSFRETALFLLLTHPDLTPRNQAEKRNAVRILTQLRTFPDFVQQVANAYFAARKNNQSPDYSNLNANYVINELAEATRDNTERTFSGVTLKGLNVNPISAKFRLHNDFKRFILAYPSRVKMADNNLIVVEQEDALPLIDVLNDILEKGFNQVEDKIDSHLPSLDSEDKDFIEDLKEWIQEIENEQIAENPSMNEVFQFAMPYILNSSNADYWTIVWDFFVDDLIYGFEHEESIFETESDDIEVEYKGYDKIFLDIYGLGLPKGKSWSDYTSIEKSRIVIACLWGSYHDVFEPLWKMITSGIKAYKATKGYKFDFRYGARKYPECALVAKLYQNFKKNKQNVEKLAENADKGDVKAIMKQFSKFALDQLLTIPKESDNVEDKRTYTNLIYNIWKKYTNTPATAEEFRKKWKASANGILSGYNCAKKTIDASEAFVNAAGGIQAFIDSKLQETIVIDKYDKPFIEVLEPLYTPTNLNQTIQFKWRTYKAERHGKFLYDLVFAAETPDKFNIFTVQPNIDGESYEVNLSQISEIRNANRVQFQLIAHDDTNPNVRYANTEFMTLFSNLAQNLPKFVDLGLPSGTLWAECNLGATQSDENGDYYAWGETDTKTSFSWKNYKYCRGTSTTLTKYCTKSSYGNNQFTDNLIELQGSDDPLSKKYGYFYSIPTKEDWEELMEYCSWTQLENGVMIRGKQVNGNYTSIYLPSAGYRNGLNLYDENSEGYYWSSTLDKNSPDDAWFLYFGKGKPQNYDYYRYYGRSIRPVMHTYDSQKSAPKQVRASESTTPMEKQFDGIVVKTTSRSTATE